MIQALSRRLAAEFLGTATLVVAVVGSGIMATSLTTDGALALLANTVATGAILAVLISVLHPISGAHLNPAVTLVEALCRRISVRHALGYALAQVAGGMGGAVLAHAMFVLPLLQIGATARTGAAQWLSEGVATFGLVFLILVYGGRAERLAGLVGLYIASAYWFTASTSFANPAVTIARSLSDSFAGIRPIDVPAFVVAQIAGALAALILARWVLPKSPHSA